LRAAVITSTPQVALKDIHFTYIKRRKGLFHTDTNDPVIRIEYVRLFSTPELRYFTYALPYKNNYEEQSFSYPVNSPILVRRVALVAVENPGRTGNYADFDVREFDINFARPTATSLDVRVNPVNYTLPPDSNYVFPGEDDPLLAPNGNSGFKFDNGRLP
jgi:hypothetical protein